MPDVTPRSDLADMQIRLEHDVISRTLSSAGRKGLSIPVGEYQARVESRDSTGVGFSTSFKPDETLRLFDALFSAGTADVGVVLDGTTQVSFLPMVERGRLTWLEGHTFGDDRWPDRVGWFELNTIDHGQVPDAPVPLPGVGCGVRARDVTPEQAVAAAGTEGG